MTDKADKAQVVIRDFRRLVRIPWGMRYVGPCPACPDGHLSLGDGEAKRCDGCGRLFELIPTGRYDWALEF